MRTAPTTLTNAEKQVIDKALRILRDRHYNNYYRSSKPEGDVAQQQLAIYHSIDQLRGKVLDL
jgi:hypothetical protein